MMIDKLSGIDPLNNVQTPPRVRGSKPVSSGADSIDVSPEARARADAYYLAKVASETPDVRTDLVNEVREKIKDPAYINQAVINSVADKILNSYFGL